MSSDSFVAISLYGAAFGLLFLTKVTQIFALVVVVSTAALTLGFYQLFSNLRKGIKIQLRFLLTVTLWVVPFLSGVIIVDPVRGLFLLIPITIGTSTTILLDRRLYGSTKRFWFGYAILSCVYQLILVQV
jgi:hypothetical protein